MKNTVHLLLLTFLFLTCSEENTEPQSLTFLTIEYANMFSANAPEKWVFATNENGELLDAAELDPGATKLELKTDKPYSRVDVTVFYVTTHLKESIYQFTTYKNYPLQTIRVGVDEFKGTARAGFSTLTLTGYPNPGYESKEVSICTTMGVNNFGDHTSTGNGYSWNVSLPENDDRIILFTKKDDVPVYKLWTGVKPGESLNVDFASLQPYENSIVLNGATYASLMAVKEDGTYIRLAFNLSTSTEPVTLGQVPGFDKYLTQITGGLFFGNMPGIPVGWSYIKRGTPISQFTPPDPVIAINNRSSADFDASINKPFDFISVIHKKVTGSKDVNWYVVCDQNTRANLDMEIPGAIRDQYPSMSLEGMEFVGGTISQSSGTFTYEDEVKSARFGIIKSEYERVSFSFQ